MPDPITAPIPSAVSDHGPRVFCKRCPGVSDSEISLSMDLQQKSWLSEVRTTSAGSVVGCDKRLESPESQPSAIAFSRRVSFGSQKTLPAKCQIPKHVGTAASAVRRA